MKASSLVVERCYAAVEKTHEARSRVMPPSVLTLEPSQQKAQALAPADLPVPPPS